MEKLDIILQVEKNVSVCAKCRLAKLAKKPVPGEGSIDSELVFIGEAPGEREDETGRPFVGRAGMLLQDLLKEIGYRREDVWIGNIIKHRPPQNRDPFPDEIAACEPYLTMQLKAISPKLVVTLGRFSMSYFYSQGKISRDHGVALKTKGYVVYPVYHPAAALRSTQVLSELRVDFLKIPKVLEEVKAQKYEQSEPRKSDIIKGQVGLGI